jgi:hypothetical protein
MSKSPFYAYILLDRSGSMENCRDTTIDAFNEYVMGFRRSDSVDARLTLTTFDSEGIDIVEHLKGAAQFPELSRNTYVPRAMTPLLDAIGKAVSDIDKVELRPDEKVGLVIITDGQENSSHEYKKDTIKALLEGRQKDKNWLITFLGAEIDAFADAGAIGISADQSLVYHKGQSRQAMGALQRSHGDYARTGSFKAAAFSAKERRDSGKQE